MRKTDEEHPRIQIKIEEIMRIAIENGEEIKRNLKY